MASSSSSNLVDVTSAEHFQSLLSADLTRVSLISFWAPWAAPCAQMNAVVAELAKRHPAALVLQVEAEEQSEIAESFDIEAVPSFVVLRGHTLLERIAGADAPAVTKALSTHASTAPPTAPLAHTDAAPAPPSAKAETPEDLDARLRALMTQARVVLFMKGTPAAPRCGFSRRIAGLLTDKGVQFASFDILEDEDVRQGLKRLNDWPTFPQLIVDGELVGGLDIVQEMVDNGEFDELMGK
ncbi:glutaredoxin [Mycena sp. CBHHK59/15]|nr:glutaredoxin [Mycena sp. CBHHK59/15]